MRTRIKGKPKQVKGVARTKDAEMTSVGEPESVLPTQASDLEKEVAQRRRAEAELRESRERLAGIIDSAMDAIITIDSTQCITLFNTAAERMFHYPAAEAIGQPLDRFIPMRFSEAHRQHIENFGGSGVTKRSMGALGAVFGLRADGEEFPVEASISQLESNGQRFYTVILRDITTRRSAEEKLKEQAALLDQAQDAILVRSLDNHILFWNKGAEHIYGWTTEETLGRDFCELLCRGDLSNFEKATQAVIGKGEWAGELRQVTKEGQEVIADCRWTLVRDGAGQPKSILSIHTNVTGQRKLEAQFLRAQRMESIGTLAGGIAHDLNNILAPILMAVQMLELKTTDEASRRMLELLRANTERGSEMVKQILSFARGVSGERVAVQPRHLIKEVVKILKETFPKSIAVKFNIVDDLWLINGDATQLHQILMNLCVNARDAMPAGGTVIITADNTIVDETYAEMMLSARPGRYVRIGVADTGVGIAPEHQNQIFDPFFTTKDVGQGTGLGLATVMGIVRSHDGFVNVYSEIGKGTQFTLYLPAFEASLSQQSPPAQPGLISGRGELILVVDDEQAIREITKTTLEAFNYRVLTANDGAQAVGLFARNLGEINAVLTDMMMPVMDGTALTHALRSLDPQIKIIASSGHYTEAKIAEASNAGVNVFLPKPYTAEKLLKTLAEVLVSGKN
jgi:two-component system cell cycle sensor histidine kinase/response regulator CckA